MYFSFSKQFAFTIHSCMTKLTELSGRIRYHSVIAFYYTFPISMQGRSFSLYEYYISEFIIIHPHLQQDKEHGICLLLPFFSLSVFPCFAPPQSTPTPCPKSSEGHPGAQEVAVMSANEPIDSLSTG